MSKTFLVFHRNEPTFMENDVAVLAENFPEGFLHVASVETDDVNAVFGLTNHISRPWWENENVTRIHTARSTSVGDVIVELGTERAWSVAFAGLTPFVLYTDR